MSAMKQVVRKGLWGVLGLGLLTGPAWWSSDAGAAPPKPGAAAKAPVVLPPPPMVKQPISVTPEGFRIGMSMAEVFDFYDKVMDQDEAPRYKKVQPGPQLTALDAELAEKKAAFRRGVINFGDLPTGIDQTALKGEYNYKDSESMATVSRAGITRYFFFQSKRLWKVYDEVPLKAGGDYGATYKEAVVALSKRFGISGRVLAADFDQGRKTTEVDWGDASLHVRALDRSQEGLLALVIEERSMGTKMASLRASQKDGQGAVDPLITMVTRGGESQDSNATAADAYTGKAHASAGGPPPTTKPKK